MVATRPFNASDASSFQPLMAMVKARLGRKPRFGTWGAAYDAHYVYAYFHQAGGFAAVPFNPGGPQRAKRAFAPDGAPLCAADLPMTIQFRYQHRSDLIPHMREKYRCPLLHPTATGEACPIADAHWDKGGYTTTIAAGAGSRIRHQLDRAVTPTRICTRCAPWSSGSTAMPKRWTCCIPSCGAGG